MYLALKHCLIMQWRLPELQSQMEIIQNPYVLNWGNLKFDIM
jgi:hypothetical protein